jgi:hypothetical protein
MKESSSRGFIKEFHGILAKTHVKILKEHWGWNSKVLASDDKFIKMIPLMCQEILLLVV